jgi:hypothetical protein
VNLFYDDLFVILERTTTIVLPAFGNNGIKLRGNSELSLRVPCGELSGAEEDRLTRCELSAGNFVVDQAHDALVNKVHKVLVRSIQVRRGVFDDYCTSLFGHDSRR